MHDRLFEASLSGEESEFCINFPLPHIHDMPYDDTISLENIQWSKRLKLLYFENNYENLIEKYDMFEINNNLKRKSQKLCSNQFERCCHMMDSKCKE